MGGRFPILNKLLIIIHREYKWGIADVPLLYEVFVLYLTFIFSQTIEKGSSRQASREEQQCRRCSEHFLE